MEESRFVTKEVFEQYKETCGKEHESLRDEDARQNARLRVLEEDVRGLGELTAAVKELAVSMKNMEKQQEKQGAELASLRARDGEMWRKFVGYVLSAVVGGALAYIFAQIGLK